MLPEKIEMYIYFLLALYEVVVRFLPTVKNYSIVSKVFALLNTLFPNRSKHGGTHE